MKERKRVKSFCGPECHCSSSSSTMFNTDASKRFPRSVRGVSVGFILVLLLLPPSSSQQGQRGSGAESLASGSVCFLDFKIRINVFNALKSAVILYFQSHVIHHVKERTKTSRFSTVFTASC